MRAFVLLFAISFSACLAHRPVSALPPTFHWGVATSGYQSEGACPDSNWSRYVARERSPHEPYRNSVDFYSRYREDVALAADMGLNTFRFSIEWARVMPKRGVVDEAELKRYDALFDAIAEKKMTPMVTLIHFVVPGWVLDEGGLTNDAIVGAFSDFVKLVAKRYRGRGTMWITINEPSYFLTLERRHGDWPLVEVTRAKNRLIAMHRNAYALIHSIDAGAPVSVNVVWEPAPASWVDDWVFPRVVDRIDFIAIDYYYSLTPTDFSARHAVTGEFWRIDFHPDAMLLAIRDYHRRAPTLPVYVVENGMATDDGQPRPDGYTRSQHLRDHLYWLQRARDEGIDVIGYNYWSITDNYEWGNYRNRFGLYTVDVANDATLTRRPTDAVETLKQLVKQGGVQADYVPVK